jgi:DNA-binding response OmpR family regulator
LLWDVWGYDENIRTRTLDVHIGRLRRKLEIDTAAPAMIVTVPSVGYRLQSRSAEAHRSAA